MTLTFRSLGKKFHHSIWCFLTLYVLVPFSLAFVSSGGLELVSISSFFSWFSLQESYHHITCHSLRCCPVSNSSIGLPHKVTKLGSRVLLWHPIALTSHWLWHPFALASLCFDIPDMWHRLCCVIIWIQKWFGPWAAWIWFYDMLRSVTRYVRPCKILNPKS